MQKMNRKKQYFKPVLTRYGDFQTLTAGGSGVITEGMMMTAGMRRP